MNTFTLSKKKHTLFSDYCQYLLSCFTNFTQTYFAKHTDRWSHDQLNRFLRNENIPTSEFWTSVKDDIDFDEEGYLIFDDVVLSKIHSKLIEVARSQWSGSHKKVIQGIGIVACLYVNPKTHEYWVIDYRIYDIDHDGKTKIDHLLDMLRDAYSNKQLLFRTVLMDSWYASMKVMKAIDRHQNIEKEPLKPHRDYDIIGYPTNMQEVRKLVEDEKKRHDFANWAVTHLGMTPTTDVGDGGKDGVGQVALWNPETEEETSRRIVGEVKTGNFQISHVRAFCHTIREQDAVAGVFHTKTSNERYASNSSGYGRF